MRLTNEQFREINRTLDYNRVKKNSQKIGEDIIPHDANNWIKKHGVMYGRHWEIVSGDQIIVNGSVLDHENLLK